MNGKSPSLQRIPTSLRAAPESTQEGQSLTRCSQRAAGSLQQGWPCAGTARLQAAPPDGRCPALARSHAMHSWVHACPEHMQQLFVLNAKVGSEGVSRLQVEWQS